MFSIDTTTNLILGLVTGLVFGFLLQRGGVTRYRVILGQFLWVDHTVLRTMLTAVVVGSAGVYALHLNTDVSLHIKGAAIIATKLHIRSNNVTINPFLVHVHCHNLTG